LLPRAGGNYPSGTSRRVVFLAGILVLGCLLGVYCEFFDSQALRKAASQ